MGRKPKEQSNIKTQTKKISGIYNEHHFAVKYKIKSAEEGGRSTPAKIGIRWDVRFPDLYDQAAFAIYPDFLDKKTNTPIVDRDMDAPNEGTALMHINNQKNVHLYKEVLKKGTRFYFVEGKKICAEGTITEVFVTF